MSLVVAVVVVVIVQMILEATRAPAIASYVLSIGLGMAAKVLVSKWRQER